MAKKNSKEEEVKAETSNDVFSLLDKMIQTQFEEVVDLSKVDGKVKNWYDTGIYSLNYAMSKNLKFGLPAGRITSYTGLSGCLHEDTLLKINRGENSRLKTLTIRELFEKIDNGNWDINSPTNTFSYKGEDGIRYNEIKEVINSGIKECFELVTEKGKKIICSEEHPFLTKDKDERGILEKDGFVPLKSLIIGEKIMVKSNKSFEHKWEKIISITSVGECQTYDIRMKEPYSNFVANDIIVHNTGKSLLAATAMKDPQLDMIIVIETEGGGQGKELIEFAGVDPNKVRILKANTFSSYKINKKNNKIEEISDDKFPVKKETDEFICVEGATRMIKRLVNSLEFNPKLRESKILIILDSLGNLQSVRELSGCYSFDTLVLTTEGYKKISDIKVGEFVKTHLDTFEEVENVFTKDEDELIEIEIESGEFIRLTKNHPLLVERNGKKEWIKSKDIKNTDILQMLTN